MSPETAIIDTVNLFHLSVDRRDWETARACLADVVQFAPDGLHGGQEFPADRFLTTIRANVESFAATQHLVAGHHVRLDSDATASCLVNVQFHHITDTGRWVLAGQQETHFHRAQDSWRITAVKLFPAWEDGRRTADGGRGKTGKQAQRQEPKADS